MATAANPDTESLLFSIDLDHFPEVLWIIRDQFKRYGCWVHDNVKGLAAFSTKERATEWAQGQFPPMLMRPEEVTFDEAREIAKSRPDNLQCLYLLDTDEPLIHWLV